MTAHTFFFLFFFLLLFDKMIRVLLVATQRRVREERRGITRLTRNEFLLERETSHV